MPKFGTKKALFGYFWDRILSHLKSAPWNLSNLVNFVKKWECQNLGPKMPCLGIFGLELWKTIVIFEIRILKFVYFQNFPQKTKMPGFRTKNALFGYFWAGILKNYCHIWNQHRQIFLIAKFRGKTKMPKFRTKMAYLEIFEQKCLIWKFLGWNFKYNIVIFEISTLEFV